MVHTGYCKHIIFNATIFSGNLIFYNVNMDLNFLNVNLFSTYTYIFSDGLDLAEAGHFPPKTLPVNGIHFS